jgi:hypothetical protein
MRYSSASAGWRAGIVGKRYEETKWTWASYSAISSCDLQGDRWTYQVVRHLRARVGHIVGLIHSVHDDVRSATGMPRALRKLTLRVADAIALGLTSGNLGNASSCATKRQDSVSQHLRSTSHCISGQPVNLQSLNHARSTSFNLSQEFTLSCQPSRSLRKTYRGPSRRRPINCTLSLPLSNGIHQYPASDALQHTNTHDCVSRHSRSPWGLYVC